MMTRLFTAVAIAALLLVPTAGFAQAPANPFTDAVKAQLAQVKDPVVRTAAKVPEDLYAFKPTPEVRSLGQLIGHIADANYGICGAGGGEKPPVSGIEKSTTTKAGLQKALADSFAFCEKVLASMDDKKGAETAKTFLGVQPRLMVLAFNNSHAYEHYGNLVTYMRLKGIVPPSSEPPK
jgi:uncharacterized damage-inducible protein DinB